MEPKIANTLSQYPYQYLQDIAGALYLNSRKKESLLTRHLYEYLISEDGSRHAKDRLDSSFTNAFYQSRVAQVQNELQEDSISCICGTKKSNEVSIQCANWKKYQHKVCVGNLVLNQVYECPRWLLSILNPFSEAVQILSPPKLLAKAGKESNINIPFNLSQSDQEKLKQTGYQIELRSISLNTTGYHHAWPQQGTLLINRTKSGFMTFVPVPSNVSKKRQDSIHVLNKQQLGLSNQIEMTKTSDQESFAIIVLLTRNVTPKEIFDRISNFPQVDFVGRMAMETPTGDITSDSMTTSLTWQYSFGNLIKTPVRGEHCKHIPVFDLMTYLTIQQSSKNPKWKCPVWKLSALRPQIDSFFSQILEEAKYVEGAYAVQLYYGKNYKILGDNEQVSLPSKRTQPEQDSWEKKRKVEVSENSNGNGQAEIICLDSD